MPPPLAPGPSLAEEELVAEVAATAPVPGPTSGFVVSYTRKGRHGKLHAAQA